MRPQRAPVSTISEATAQWLANHKDNLIVDCLMGPTILSKEACLAYQHGSDYARRVAHKDFLDRRQKCRQCKHYKIETVTIIKNGRTEEQVTQEREHNDTEPGIDTA